MAAKRGNDNVQAAKAPYAEVIRKYRLRQGVEAKSLSLSLGFSANAVTNWERGFSRPDIDTIPRLCEALRIPVRELLGMDAEDEISGPELTHMTAYRSLSADRRRIVDQLTESMYRQQEDARLESIRAAFRPCILYEEAAAAGIGSPMDGISDSTTVYVRVSPVLERTDFLIRVNGESMEPDYPDGSIVCVQRTEELREGETGIFVLNGESYLKQYTRHGLHSLNPDYADIPVYEGNDCKTVGRVIGVLSDRDYPSQKEMNSIAEAFS